MNVTKEENKSGFISRKMNITIKHSIVEGNNSNTTTGEEIGSFINITNATAGSTMTVVTLSGQILVFLTIYFDKRLQTPTNYYIISLACADFLISILSMPVWTIYTTLNYWPFSQLLCDFWNSLDYALCLISMHTIGFISIERYRSVSNPLTHKIYLTAKQMRMYLIGIWITDFTIWTVFIFMTQRYYAPIRNPKDCGVAYITEPILAISWGVLMLTLPVAITAIIYILIFRIAQRAGVMNVKISKSKSGISFTNSVDMASEGTVNASLDKESNNQKKDGSNSMNNISTKGTKEEKERKAVKTIALLLATFAICWLPMGALFIAEGIAPGYLDISWMIAGYWLGYANSMLNPVCYAIGNPVFKESLSKYLCKCRK